MDTVFPSFLFINILAGLAMALLFGQAAIRLARRLALMDLPGALPHKKHREPTPLAGGLTLVLALAAGSLVFGGEAWSSLWRLFAPALIVFAFGLWDDFKRLPAWVKLLGQLLAGALLIALGTSAQVLQYGTLGLGSDAINWANRAITLFWLVGITNAMNLIDSMDGIVIGTGGLAIAFMILVTLISPDGTLLELLPLLLGVLLGLYYYNATPARFFLGDSGAQTIGFLLAAIGIQFTPGARPLGSSWFVPILILGLPIFDTTMVTVSRLLRRMPIYKAGLDHTFHRLATLGLDDKRAVMVMHITTIVLGCTAFIALGLEPLYATIVFATVCLTGAILIAWFEWRSRHDRI